ncbi:glycosyltransferase family 1 protein [Patescibacteria group bacterium]|nr:MAG: glycosyltransferase family 1 protein [Patescibacteria group bacterium]
MTVLQVNKFWFARGGAERYALDLSDWLSAQGHAVVPFAMAHPDNIPTPYDGLFPPFRDTEHVRFGASGLRTFLSMGWNRAARRGMKTLIRQTRPHVAHVHNIYTQLSPSVLDALSKEKVPCVYTVHDHHLVSPSYNLWADGCGPSIEGKGVVAATMSRFHKKSYVASFAQAFTFAAHRRSKAYQVGIDAYLCPSEYMARRLVAAGFPEEKIRHLPHGIDPDAVAPRFDHDGYVLFVGRLVPEKGVETVLRVARVLPEVRFRIVGTGPDETRLHVLAHGLTNVEFLGSRFGVDLDELYRGAAAVLIPSRVHEVFPLVALEAMRAGKPVAASHVGGMSEVVTDRVTGFLVNPLDMHGWAEAVLRMVYDDAARRSMGREGRRQAETTFHVRRHREKLMGIYREIGKT